MHKPRSRSGFDNGHRDACRLATLEARVDKNEMQNLRRGKARFYAMDFGVLFMYKFNLYIGKSKFPRSKLMTLAECGKANRALREKFIKTFDSKGETKHRMSMWKAENSKKIEYDKDKYIKLRLERQIETGVKHPAFKNSIWKTDK